MQINWINLFWYEMNAEYIEFIQENVIFSRLCFKNVLHFLTDWIRYIEVVFTRYLWIDWVDISVMNYDQSWSKYVTKKIVYKLKVILLYESPK